MPVKNKIQSKRIDIIESEIGQILFGALRDGDKHGQVLKFQKSGYQKLLNNGSKTRG
jgi:hypothetical protein